MLDPTLTRMYNTGNYRFDNISLIYFFAHSLTRAEYSGHGKIYAYQEWGSTRQNYEIMNTIELPPQFMRPPIVIVFLFLYPV